MSILVHRPTSKRQDKIIHVTLIESEYKKDNILSFIFNTNFNIKNSRALMEVIQKHSLLYADLQDRYTTLGELYTKK